MTRRTDPPHPPGAPAPESPLRCLPGLCALLALSLAPTLSGCVALTPYSEVVERLPPGELLEVDGNRVHVVDRGPRDAPPVVLVHGFGASAYSWRKVTAELPDLRTVALDLRGFGYTERPPGLAPYTRRGQVELVRGVLDRLELHRVHLVGHSYGGAITLAFAARYPERLLSLTAVDSARPDYPEDRRRAIAGLRPVTGFYVRAWALRRASVRRALEHSVRDDSLVTPELVDAYLDRLRIEGASRAYHGVTAPAPEAEEEVRLEEIEVPVLVIWGAEDPLIPLAKGREEAERLPCHRFVTLEETGHLPMEERPETVAEALRGFVRDPRAACRDRSEPGR